MSLAALALIAIGVLLVAVAPGFWLPGLIVILVGAVAGLLDITTKGA